MSHPRGVARTGPLHSLVLAIEETQISRNRRDTNPFCASGTEKRAFRVSIVVQVWGQGGGGEHGEGAGPRSPLGGRVTLLCDGVCSRVTWLRDDMVA
jgi:hypothetical protein